jgi:hypothetical protein
MVLAQFRHKAQPVAPGIEVYIQSVLPAEEVPESKKLQVSLLNTLYC